MHSITSSTTAFVRAQPSGGKTTQDKTPLFGPTCLGAQTARLRNGNFNPSASPGVEGLTEEDWAKLDELVKAQGGGKPN
jgi:hypothetical protein